VAIGGGHGLATTLRAASTYAGELTGVVSVADDGHSSGKLRRPGLPAMGDLRRCLTALGDPDNPWTAAFEHRFADGHALGNLAIAALTDQLGDFVAVLDEMAAVLGLDADHRVLPATDVLVELCAATHAGDVHGQLAVTGSRGIERVWLDPIDPPVPAAVVKAVATADQIVVGPGSLYSSILAALSVPGLREAVNEARAPKVYVANLRPQVPETEGYDTADHLRALAAHGFVADVVVDDRALARPNGLAHDPERLAAALAALSLGLESRSQPTGGKA
jgi:uncharacterized cofD-like protein